MGEGGRKLGQADEGVLSIEEQLRLDVKKSGTRRIPVPGEYSLGRGAVDTERPGIYEGDEDDDLDKTKVDIPRQSTMRPLEAADAVDGVELPSFPENAQSEEGPVGITMQVAAWVNNNMASEHPSASRDEKLPTIVDPIVAKGKLHEAGVEDDLPTVIDSEQLPNVIDFRKRQQEKVMGVVLKGGVDFAWPWWESSDPLVHVWAQLHSVSVVPDWKFKKDLETLIEDADALELCMRVHNGKISFVKVEIEKALFKRFSQGEIDARVTIAKDLSVAKKVTKR